MLVVHVLQIHVWGAPLQIVQKLVSVLQHSERFRSSCMPWVLDWPQTTRRMQLPWGAQPLATLPTTTHQHPWVTTTAVTLSTPGLHVGRCHCPDVTCHPKKSTRPLGATGWPAASKQADNRTTIQTQCVAGWWKRCWQCLCIWYHAEHVCRQQHNQAVWSRWTGGLAVSRTLAHHGAWPCYCHAASSLANSAGGAFHQVGSSTMSMQQVGATWFVWLPVGSCCAHRKP